MLKRKKYFLYFKDNKRFYTKGFIPFALTEKAGVLFIGVGDKSFEKFTFGIVEILITLKKR